MDNVLKAKIIVAVTLLMSAGLLWYGFLKVTRPQATAPVAVPYENLDQAAEDDDHFLPDGVIEVESAQHDQRNVTSSNEPQILQIALDGRCLTKKTKGSPLLVSVIGTKLTCDSSSQENCEPYEHAQAFSFKVTKGKRFIKEIPVNLDEITKQLHTRWGNLMLGVVLCEDTNGNGKCDETPLHQALRLNGRYLESANYQGALAIHLISEPSSPVAACGSI